MTPESTVITLFWQMLVIAMIILCILLLNNMVLYRQKLKDHLSLMLISAVVMCMFEFCWDFCDGRPGLEGALYFGCCGYVMSFVAFSIQLNKYMLEKFDRTISDKWAGALFYKVPPGLLLLACITTPWTGWLFRADENGFMREYLLYDLLFNGQLMLYLLTALGCAIAFIMKDGHKDRAATRVAFSLIVFAVLIPLIYAIQIISLGDASKYLVMSLTIAVSQVYLTANVSTNSLMESRAQIEATEADLRIAAKIQTDALPPGDPDFAEHPELELRAVMSTAKEVGGDFYDYFAIDQDRICFLIADVSGKGTPAALFMMTAKTMIKDYALIHGDTAEAFTTVNARLSENNEAGMFATAWIGILDTRTNTLQYTNAGHNYPVLKRAGEQCTLLKGVHGLFLAGMDDTEYRSAELQLSPGDRLLLYTDGVTEAHDRDGSLYGTERLLAVMESSSEKSGAELLEMINDDINGFAVGVPQFDDITMIVLTMR